MCSNAFARQNQPRLDLIAEWDWDSRSCVTLIELHGGTVTAASDGENRGSTFTIHLPLATVDKGRASRADSQNDER